MHNPYNIILRPRITEKSTGQKEGQNQYVFEVSTCANKIEIGNAVQELFGVKVQNVRTINCEGKSVRFGMRKGRRSDWKKAIVTLKAGEKISILEMA